MLKRLLRKFRPSPAMAVALLALIGTLGGTGWAANGGAFILGVINGATQRTFLGANFNGSALQVNNISTSASAVPLQLTAAPGHPPIKVNTATKVANLNADYLDGIDSTALTRVHNVPYNLAAHTDSAPISFPPGRPVQVIGVSVTTGDPGVAQASIFGYAALNAVVWVGVNSWNNAAIRQGGSATPGDVIVYLDQLQTVSVDVAGPNAIRVHNASGGQQNGNVSLMWVRRAGKAWPVVTM